MVAKKEGILGQTHSKKWCKDHENSSCGKGRENGKSMRTTMSHPSIDSWYLNTFRKVKIWKTKNWEKNVIRQLIRNI